MKKSRLLLIATLIFSPLVYSIAQQAMPASPHPPVTAPSVAVEPKSVHKRDGNKGMVPPSPNPAITAPSPVPKVRSTRRPKAAANKETTKAVHQSGASAAKPSTSPKASSKSTTPPPRH